MKKKICNTEAFLMKKKKHERHEFECACCGRKGIERATGNWCKDCYRRYLGYA